MTILRDGIYYDKKMASGAFVDSENALFALMCAFDKRCVPISKPTLPKVPTFFDVLALLHVLTHLQEFGGNKLVNCLKQNKSDVFGVVFSENELTDDKLKAPNAYILAQKCAVDKINVQLNKAPIASFNSVVLDIETVSAISSMNCSSLRALLSGELLVMATSESNKNMLFKILHEIQRAFDDCRVLDDLSTLITKDIRKTSKDMGQIIDILSDGEFQIFAGSAMNRRRVEPCVQPHLMSKLRANRGCVEWGAGQRNSAQRTFRS